MLNKMNEANLNLQERCSVILANAALLKATETMSVVFSALWTSVGAEMWRKVESVVVLCADKNLFNP